MIKFFSAFLIELFRNPAYSTPNSSEETIIDETLLKHRDDFANIQIPQTQREVSSSSQREVSSSQCDQAMEEFYQSVDEQQKKFQANCDDYVDYEYLDEDVINQPNENAADPNVNVDAVNENEGWYDVDDNNNPIEELHVTFDKSVIDKSKDESKHPGTPHNKSRRSARIEGRKIRESLELLSKELKAKKSRSSSRKSNSSPRRSSSMPKTRSSTRRSSSATQRRKPSKSPATQKSKFSDQTSSGGISNRKTTVNSSRKRKLSASPARSRSRSVTHKNANRRRSTSLTPKKSPVTSHSAPKTRKHKRTYSGNRKSLK